MSDRAGITFTADIDENPVARKLARLEQEIRARNADLTALEAKTLAMGEMAGETIHDALFMIEQVTQILGIELTATQQLALDMLQQGALAAAHVMKLWTVMSPFTAVMMAGAYATVMAMQVQAYADLEAQGAEAQAQFQRAQQSMQLLMRFM